MRRKRSIDKREEEHEKEEEEEEGTEKKVCQERSRLKLTQSSHFILLSSIFSQRMLPMSFVGFGAEKN